MKQGLMLTALFIFIGIVGWQKEQAPKTYTVTLPLQTWQNIINHLDSTSKIMIESDLPARKVAWANSGIANIMQTIQFQVSKEMQEEQKSDSTKPKNKK